MKHLALLLLVTLGGCAVWSTPERLTQLPLPEPHQLDCCWQSQERVQIATPGDTFTFDAAVAVTPGQLTLVAFDGLGRRLLTLSHTGGTPQILVAPADWSAALSHQLLLAVYLHHLPSDAWHFDEPGWSVMGEGDLKTIRYRQRALVRLRYLPAEAPQAGREIDYIDQAIRLTVHSLSRTAL